LTTETSFWLGSTELNNAEFSKCKFNEQRILSEIEYYILNTYSQHYASDKLQALEIVQDAGYGEGFIMGNILKYWKRYGKKNGKNRQDLLKIIHYAILQLSLHDKEAAINKQSAVEE
jgi:hypothetical protein